MSIFKVCDIRGVYGGELTDDTAYRLGRVVGARLAGRSVAVGGDLRPSTAALKAALVAGLQRGGARVIDLGLVPTPAFYFGRARLGATGGIMVTASHNPPRYNGFKLILGDLPITPEELQALAAEMAALPAEAIPDMTQEAAGGTVAGDRAADTMAAYADSLVAAFRGLRRRRVVVDAGNGSMWHVAPAVLRRLGQEVVALFCTPDGTFPGRDPNPAVPEHLAALRQAVHDHGADLGVAYDGDGDRAIFVDQRGRVIPADRTFVVLVRHLLPTEPGAGVVYDLKSSVAVPEAISAAGGRPLMERSGHAFIKRRMIREHALLAGEISGHYFFRAVNGDDPLYATGVLLQALDALGEGLAAAIDTVPAYPISPDIRLPCPADRAAAIQAEVLAAFSDHPIDTLDERAHLLCGGLGPGAHLGNGAAADPALRGPHRGRPGRDPGPGAWRVAVAGRPVARRMSRRAIRQRRDWTRGPDFVY